MCIPYVLVNNLLWNWLLHIRAIAEGYCFTFCIYLIRLLLCLSKPGSLPAQDPSQPEIPVKPRSQSAQDPSQPKIPVSPRSQSALDALMPIWLMFIWYLTHPYLIFGSCLHGSPTYTKITNTVCTTTVLGLCTRKWGIFMLAGDLLQSH